MPTRAPTPDELLVRWHRWASALVRVEDTIIQDFNRLMLSLPDDVRSALVFHARNLCCDATVWSSNRKLANLSEARTQLAAAMNVDRARWAGPRVVYLNERGNRVGESNPQAVLSDHEVALLLELREEGYSYGWLAAKFDVHKATVQGICNSRRRGQSPAKVKKETM